MKLNHFSLDKIKKTKKNPIKIKNASPKLNILYNNKNKYIENSFLNKSLNNFNKSNSFIYKNNIYQKHNNNSYEEILESLEKEMKYLNTNEYINNIIKVIEKYQNELSFLIEQKNNKNDIKNILKNYYENIIKYSSNYFSLYKNKCLNFLFSLKKTIKNLINNQNANSNSKYMKNNNKDKNMINFDYSLKNSENSRQIVNNYTHNNNNIIIFDENKKKHFLNEEENLVNLINNLSSNIRICNKKYKSSLINIANLIDFSNNKLIEIKNKLESINDNIISKEIDNIYLININIITEVKLLDDNQKIFFDEAKDIFNNLKINHKIKIKEYQKLFDSIQNIQSYKNNRSESKKEKQNYINCFYTFNNLSLNKNNKNKKIYSNNNYNKKEIRGKSLPNEIKTNINDLKYFKINLNNNNNRTRNLSNLVFNETSPTYNNRNNSYNMTNSFNNSNINTNNNKSFNNTCVLQNNIFSFKDDNNSLLINKNYKNSDLNDIFFFAENIMEFFNKMNDLQKSIINKKPNITQQKRDFEIFKKQLIQYTTNIISQKDKIKNKNNDISKFLNDNKKFENNININNNILNTKNNKYQLEKLKIIQTENFALINSNKINNNYEEKIINLTKNNKDLNEEIIKTKEENNILKTNITNFFNLINNNILKETENFNLNQKELKEQLNLYFNKNKNKEEKNDKIDNEIINKIKNEFELYFNEILKYIKNINEKKVIIKESKDNLLEKEIKENINDKNNNEDEKNNTKSKISLIIDTEGELSFKGESFKINNNLQNNEEENNRYISSLLDNNNNTGSFSNFNNNLNKLYNNNSKNSNEPNINNNDFENDINKNTQNEINKDNDTNSNNNYLDINKEILKYQNNLKNRIKSLEEEVEIQKNKNLNFFIEIKNELCDFNEEKISLSKYINLMKLYEKEQETNKILEKKYISTIEKINTNLLNYFKKINFELVIDENIPKNIITTSQENEKKYEKNSNINRGNNLHFDYSNMFKAKSILKMNEENYDNNKDNKNNKELKMKNLIEENDSLKKNEKLLLVQLNTIKAEIKELKNIIEEKNEKIKLLNQNLEKQTTSLKDKIYLPLRNGLELLIMEISLNNKIKDILRNLLNICLYNNEEIEKIFKYRDKKKNIVGIFKF